MDVMSMNASIYTVQAQATQQTIALKDNDKKSSSAVIYNPTNADIFVYSSMGTPGAGTVVFPTVAGAQPLYGSVIPAKGKEPYFHPMGQDSITVIQAAGGTAGPVYIQLGAGQ